MDSLLDGLKGIVKGKEIQIDNIVFRMHYRLTLTIIVAFSILVTARQYIGDPIDCISKDDIPHDLLDTYCWIHPTFSIASAWHKEVGHEVPYPGVDKYTKDEKKEHHAYYQWVCFVLYLQAVLFYLPRYFWKAMEGKRMSNLIMDLNSPIGSSDSNKELLVKYLVNSRKHNNSYYFFYCLAEIMNAVNVIGQIFLIDRFLDGEFSMYGHRVLQFTDWHWSARYDPMLKVFPRLAKCTFYKYGSSGSVQRHDAMCILPLNIINEKIYVFLWFWFIILSIASCLAVLYRLVVTLPLMRIRARLIRTENRLVSLKLIVKVVEQLSVANWYLLYSISDNIDERNFQSVLEKYAEELEKLKLDDQKSNSDNQESKSGNQESKSDNQESNQVSKTNNESEA